MSAWGRDQRRGADTKVDRSVSDDGAMTHKVRPLTKIEARYTEQGESRRMRHMNPNEHKARLEAIRAQSDADYARERAERQANLREITKDLYDKIDELRCDGAKSRMTTIICSISIVLGIAGVNAALMSAMQASFETGLRAGGTQAEILASIRRIEHHLDSLEARVDRLDQRLGKVESNVESIKHERSNGD